MEDSLLTQNAMKMIQGNGRFAVTQACQKILSSQYGNGVISKTLHYYAKSILPNVLPIFPALIYLSSKAVGGNPENTKPVAVAMLLITASGDIHDDIVDNSEQKFGKETIVGKYGKDSALLAGDVLLVQGMAILQNECNVLSSEKSKIVDLITSSLFKIVNAEAIETSLWRKANVSPQEYLDVIKLKGGIAELHCIIGGIIGGGKEEDINSLASYGRAIGVLATLKEEFVDMASPTELEHRIKHELPPYPMIYAMQQREIKEKISGILKKDRFSDADLRMVADLVLSSSRTKNLADKFREYGRKELSHNLLLRNDRAKELVVLLEALSEELLLV